MTEKDRVSGAAERWVTPIYKDNANWFCDHPFIDDAVDSLTSLIMKEIKRAERSRRVRDAELICNMKYIGCRPVDLAKAILNDRRTT